MTDIIAFPTHKRAIMLNDTIREQLNTAQAGLLCALSGEKDLATYHTELTQLLDTISVSTSTARLDTSTAALARNVAMRVASVTDCLADIKRELRGLSDGLQDGWKNVLAKLPASTADQSRASHSQEVSTTANDTTLRHSSYLSPAYRWLLDNLDNPYPTAKVKERIASCANCSVASVNSWFMGARRRIGWTAICRQHFDNCRADAVDAAYRALVKGDASRTVSSEVSEAFLTMKTTAETLYSSTPAENPFSVDVDGVVKDTSESDGSHSDDNSKNPKTPAREVGGDEDLFDCTSPWSYRRTLCSPIVNPSHVPTPEPSFSSESDDEDDVSPPVVTGQKRRVGPSGGPDLAYRKERVRKRRRISTVSGCSAEVSSRVPLTQPLGNESLPTSPEACSQVTSMPHYSRKRRLSDADGQFYPKRPQGVPNGRRVQAVSDPLPKSSAIESSINDWFSINFPDIFDVPPPADVDELDPSVLWQVELFSDYRIPEAPRKKFQKGNSIVLGRSCSPVDTSQPTMDVATPEIPEFSNFLQALDDSVYDQTFLAPDMNGPHLFPASLSHNNLSPLGVCPEPSYLADPCDFLDTALSQSFVTVGDFGGDTIDLSTWANNFSGTLQTSSTGLSHLNAVLDNQLYRQLSSPCI